MKIYLKHLLFLCCFSLILSNCSSQINLNKISKKVSKKVLGNDSGTANNSISHEEVIAGLKEALTVGIQNGSSRASKVDGFLKNEKIQLLTELPRKPPKKLHQSLYKQLKRCPS